jgi:hypothetical protein
MGMRKFKGGYCEVEVSLVIKKKGFAESVWITNVK